MNKRCLFSENKSNAGNVFYDCEQYNQKSCSIVLENNFTKDSIQLSVGTCAGCSETIQDRFYLSSAEEKWHVGCLRCCICCKPLEEAKSCFSKDDRIYCKIDYFRVFGAKKCSRCEETIMKNELVMRAKHLIFHVRCFACDSCNIPLTKGDHYGIKNSNIYCKLHFDSLLTHIESGSELMQHSEGSSNQYQSSIFSQSVEDKVLSRLYNDISDTTLKHRQKGRPRKRKQKLLDGNSASSDISTGYLELGFPRDCLANSSRAKRMRTSFKHHQLRAMKSYFAINHNPDAKDLKQLSQKTGLPKRVLQVWFQNARAKFRRMMSKQDPKNFDTDDYDSFSSPIRMMSGGTSPASVD